jgi:hypothetical protein
VDPTTGGTCYDVPKSSQCTPCSTQAAAAHCPSLYYPSLSGSPTDGCTVTCQ